MPGHSAVASTAEKVSGRLAKIKELAAEVEQIAREDGCEKILGGAEKIGHAAEACITAAKTLRAMDDAKRWNPKSYGYWLGWREIYNNVPHHRVVIGRRAEALPAEISFIWTGVAESRDEAMQSALADAHVAWRYAAHLTGAQGGMPEAMPQAMSEVISHTGLPKTHSQRSEFEIGPAFAEYLPKGKGDPATRVTREDSGAMARAFLAATANEGGLPSDATGLLLDCSVTEDYGTKGFSAEMSAIALFGEYDPEVLESSPEIRAMCIGLAIAARLDPTHRESRPFFDFAGGPASSATHRAIAVAAAMRDCRHDMEPAAGFLRIGIPDSAWPCEPQAEPTDEA